MSSRSAIAFTVATLGLAGIASAASTQVTFLGGHEPARMFRVESVESAPAPYALTGNTAAEKTVRTENIWVGSRIVGVRVIRD
jgi:hypothetical protein